MYVKNLYCKAIYPLRPMTFHWKLNDDTDEKLKRFCVELEYRLRPKITRFLLKRLDTEFDGDLSRFHFDIDMITKRISFSAQTPLEYIQGIEADFDMEINRNCC
ncbi:hypothetical protein [Maribacter sp. 2-571]|uniref:hypothetical protein n=1 Tax=Maribacter sp. 2-571 TaxID=3417569 RepID=UPI003D34E0E5